jgi:hypothetical protein
VLKILTIDASGPGRRALFLVPDQLQAHDLQRLQLDLQLRDLRLEARIVPERLAVRHLALRDVLDPLQVAPVKADLRETAALVAEQIFRVCPALVLDAHQVLRRHADVVEEDLVDVGGCRAC